MVIEISSWMYDVVDVCVFNVNSFFFKSHYWELEFHLPSPQHSDSATGYMLSSSSDGLPVDMLCHRRQRQVKRKVVWTNQTDIIDELPQYRSILYTYTGCELPYGFDVVEPKTTYYGRFLLNLYKFRNRCMHFSLCTLELVCVVCVWMWNADVIVPLLVDWGDSSLQKCRRDIERESVLKSLFPL